MPPRLHPARSPGHRSVRLRGLIALILVASLTTACGGGAGGGGAAEPDGSTGEDATGTTTTSGEAVDLATWGPPTCARPVAPAPEVRPVGDLDTDRTLVSFDGTEIRLHWFPTPDASEDDPAPTVLNGPGWSMPGETATEAPAMFGSVGIEALNDRGYNVLTWDPRGFGASTGTVTVDHPDIEGRDVSLIIDWLATQPEVRLDDDGDPRLGMIGSSYGGGIQLAVAARDCRVDALVPGLAWHSLGTSLLTNETVKTGWAGALIAAASGADLDPHVRSAHESGRETGLVSDEDRDWFLDRGPGDAVGDIAVPTLLVQGTVDTLFGPAESLTNLELLTANATPTHLIWFCGGHGTCLTHEEDTAFVEEATLAWLDRWVAGDDSVTLPPGFQTTDQHGDRWTADMFPAVDPVPSGTGSGILALTEDGGSGPPETTGSDLLGALVGTFTPAPADNAVEVPLTVETATGERADGSTSATLVLGAPVLELTYSGTAPAGERPTRVFAQLIDEESGLVIGNQITPIPVELDGEEHELRIALEPIAHRLGPDAAITLQLTPTTVAYAAPRLGGDITFDRVELALPVVTGLAPAD